MEVVTDFIFLGSKNTADSDYHEIKRHLLLGRKTLTNLDSVKAPWVGKIPWRRAWEPTLVLLPGESHGERSLVGYSHGVAQESDITKVI